MYGNLAYIRFVVKTLLIYQRATRAWESTVNLEMKVRQTMIRAK